MRHRKATLKLNMTSSHRKAMFRNMVTSLFKYDRIQTTDAKAKALRGWADHIITLAKRGDLHARRQALAIIREKDVVHKLFSEAPERFKDIPGGYTRVTKVGIRPGDTAPISVIELVAADKSKKPKVKRKKTVEETPAAQDAKVEETPMALEAKSEPQTEVPPAAEEAVQSSTENSPEKSAES
jgi:large subunit ribosomal protein L17